MASPASRVLRRIYLGSMALAAALMIVGVIAVLNTDTIFHRTDLERDGDFDRVAYDFSGWYKQRGDLQGVRRSRYTPFEVKEASISSALSRKEHDWRAALSVSEDSDSELDKLVSARRSGSIATWLLTIGAIIAGLSLWPPLAPRRRRHILLIVGAVLALTGTAIFGSAIGSATEKPTAIATERDPLESGGTTSLARTFWILSAIVGCVGFAYPGLRRVAPPAKRAQAEDAEPSAIAAEAATAAPDPDAAPPCASRVQPQAQQGEGAAGASQAGERVRAFLLSRRGPASIGLTGALIVLLLGHLVAAGQSRGKASIQVGFGYTELEFEGSGPGVERSRTISYSEAVEKTRDERRSRPESAEQLATRGVIALVLVILSCALLLWLVIQVRLSWLARLGMHTGAAAAVSIAVGLVHGAAGDFLRASLPQAGSPSLTFISWFSLLLLWGSWVGFLVITLRATPSTGVAAAA